MNPLSSHLPPVFSHESIYSDDHYNLDYPLISLLNFPVINPQSAPESFINDMELSSCNPMFLMNDHHHHLLEEKTPNVCFGRKRKPIRKDKHSKIYTASGPRDRRVRLSIGIAREFFDLHDMLGFDKASKTLEWLLKKSRNAIQELAESKKKSFHKDGDEEDQDKRFGSDSNSAYFEEVLALDASRCKQKKVKRFEKCESGNHEEESTGRIENRKLKKSMHFPENITKSQFFRETVCTAGGFEDDETLPRATEDSNIIVEQDVTEESIFIKQKPILWSIPSRDFSFNNNNSNNDIVNSSQDWNSNRHEPFADSSAYPSITNINTSQDDTGSIGFHIYGKPW